MDWADLWLAIFLPLSPTSLDITTPENRAKGMGTIGAAFGLGFIAGPAIGGILAGPDALNADFPHPLHWPQQACRYAPFAWPFLP